jgi:cytochrome c-type biogenesis protein CcmH/NrfF
MEAPLSICTKEEMRGVVRVLLADGVKSVEIICRMQAQYGDNCLSCSKIDE